ncbi:hypothetical protein ACFQ5M_07075 [Agrilactobacillus yilanensis]|uniref:Uncharacterized protein n=1 Tax=Agrilactobacillus yilanensis TaxID=2485997 RepID=A0ABW4J646_9LACO|nr:hypothetical protein [Agrilactobacillus yilanensis]
MFKDDKRDFSSAEQKNLLFSAALATELGIALQAKDPPETTTTTIHIAPRDQIKVDTELAKAQLNYIKAQQQSQLVQQKLTKAQKRQKNKTAEDLTQIEQSEAQYKAIGPQKKALLAQLAELKAQQQSQQAQLQVNYDQQLAQVKAQQQQVAAYDQEIQASQDQITPNQTAQTQSALAYYSQQKHNAQQQLNQQQASLLELRQQAQRLTTEQAKDLAALERQIIARETETALYQAKILDLKQNKTVYQAEVVQQQNALQQALMEEENSFKELTAIRRKHSNLSAEQQALFATAPQLQTAGELLSITLYQNGQQQDLVPEVTNTGPQLAFAPVQDIVGYALDLDRSLVLTDQTIIGSLRDLMGELQTTAPEWALQQLNAGLKMTPGQSNRVILLYWYQRQITLVTKYQTIRQDAIQQVEATRVIQNRAVPQFELPVQQADYQLDWQRSRLKLDDYDKNYLTSYLVAADGQGPVALDLLNQDIAQNRLVAAKLTLVYQYVAATRPLQTPQGPEEATASHKIAAFGPDQPLANTAFTTPVQRTAKPTVEPAPEPKTEPIKSTLFKSQTQLVNSQQRVRPARALFGNTAELKPKLLGTYGISKFKRGQHIVNKIMPRKY